jgi:hypothetical protein
MTRTKEAPPLSGGEQAPTSPGDREFLTGLGKQVRTLREQRAMTRKLAEEASVSERYLE